MTSKTRMTLPRVEAPGLDEAFLDPEIWEMQPAVFLADAATGNAPRWQTLLRAAWSCRGLHLVFHCANTGSQNDTGDQVGVFLDPDGERSRYMTLFVNPFGQVSGARVENPLHHELQHETDAGWSCPGLRVRCWSDESSWSAELLIPFDGITPAIDPPSPEDHWTANFYRLTSYPTPAIDAWQPLHSSPPDLHKTDCFGILEFAG